MEKFKRRARDIFFWPRVNEQIKAVVSKCETCQEYQMSNPKEPMHGASSSSVKTLGNGSDRSFLVEAE